MSIEHNFDVSFVASLALKEKQIQQNYRPIIAVHKWFARRPGTLFRGLALAEFGSEPLTASFFRANNFPHKKVADPFMGGGTPLIEANRIGCDVLGVDINPMSAWVVSEEITHLDLGLYRNATDALLAHLREELGTHYQTDCPIYGDRNVPVKSFLWVKVLDCENCGQAIDLFPGYLIAQNKRHPLNVIVCSSCGTLNEAEDKSNPGECSACSETLRVEGPAHRGKCECKHCGHLNAYPPKGLQTPLRHRLFAIEYFNPHRKSIHRGRFFKSPDDKDFARYESARRRWEELNSIFVPDEPILPGDETDRLHRWGYEFYRQMFNCRQLLALELSARQISEIDDNRVRHAIATNLSDLLRYQNMLCRYDTMALKSLDIFSVHGFPVGLVQCESNILGTTSNEGKIVGSGGWINIIDKYSKAKIYCDAPFEVQRNGTKAKRIPIPGEWIGEFREGKQPRSVSIKCASSTDVEVEEGSLDAVFTDPPYFGNVQYGELMDFCYVWLRKIIGDRADGFDRPSTRDAQELTGNATAERGLDHFTNGLSAVFGHMKRALRPGAPLAFTYHHNRNDAYFAVGVAILDSGLVCSASLPCPAEMSGSIHIHGTSSSIVDTVFVCRSTGTKPRRWLFSSAEELVQLLLTDVEALAKSGRMPTKGDIRCMVFGHLTRMAVWKLRAEWEPSLEARVKLASFEQAFLALADAEEVVGEVLRQTSETARLTSLSDVGTRFEDQIDAVSF